eukprot:TRINITY_DN24421_c0_g1_i1.p1 TRINITY_DN24421_c0_g1~~TRINITY_DN24421_c0_g1_i1.p1  ORF type:complete len:1074 (+),score=312.77 TRINITY_DN24421_c0_g1_i1:150-3371(+)
MVFEKSLTAMVKGIRANRGKETEYIQTCMQEIRTELTNKNPATKSTAILKLAYLTMMGYDMSWAAFGVVEVMSSGKFALKRPGFLASSLSFNESTDVGLLCTNLFKKDFGSKSQYESGMAISCLASICSPEICKDILNDLLAMLSSSRAYLRKKTVLCLYRVFLRDPPALRTAFPKLKERLSDEDQGVLTATVNTFLELARKNAKNYLSLVPQLYHILVNTTNNWLSIKLLKIFQLLCPLEPRLPSKMVEPLTNLLSTTKAQSVEYEAIRCVVRTMPEGTQLMALAVEKLQAFLKSSDRNLRFLGLELFKEILDRDLLSDKLVVPELHEKVLQSIEESDTTARKVALHLLDKIVTPASFQDTVKKLMEFSKRAVSPDEFVGTILRMGERDRYALVEDFPWYLLVLAEMARNQDSTHAKQVAEQFVDITVRVSGVRPVAVTLALGLVDGSLTASATEDGPGSSPVAEGCIDICSPMIGACAWIIGEYHESFDAPADAVFVKAAKALLLPKHVQSLEASVQTQCVWAAVKLYLGSPKFASGSLVEMHELMEQNLPGFIQSTAVDVSERATLSLHLSRFLKADMPKVAAGALLYEETLLPVHPEAQKAVEMPEGLDLETPFFAEEQDAAPAFNVVKSDPADPFALAATYKDDLGLLAATDQRSGSATAAAPDTSKQQHQASMFHLGGKDAAASKDTATGSGEGASEEASSPAQDKPVDPLEAMRQRLMAGRSAAGGVKMEVMREDVVLPGQQAAAASSGPTASAASSAPPATSSASLPTPSEKELTDLEGRLWAVVHRDDFVVVYACVRSPNTRKQLMRLDFRCEKVQGAAGAVSSVSIKMPSGLAVQEASPDGDVLLHEGELVDRSAKVKANLGLSEFLTPRLQNLVCLVKYFVQSPEASGSTLMEKELAIPVPATNMMVAEATNEDDIAEYIATYQQTLLTQQTAQQVAFELAGRTADDLAADIPKIVGRCAGLCHLHGIQQQVADSSKKGQKVLLVAKPLSALGAAGRASSLPGQEPLPENAKIVVLCAGLPKEGGMDFKLTVKAADKSVADDICSHMVAILREIVEGRLRLG